MNPYAGLRQDIVKLHAVLKRDRRAKINKFVIGAPATDQDVAPLVEDEDGDAIHSALVELARVFNGVNLHFTWKGEAAKVEGHIVIPTLAEMHDSRQDGVVEFEVTSWRVVSKTTFGSAYLLASGVHVFNLDCYIKAESLDLGSVLQCMVSHLGLPGWELSLFDNQFDDDEQEQHLAVCQSTAREIRMASKLEIPPELK